MAENDVTIKIAALDQATQQIQRVADSLTKLQDPINKAGVASTNLAKGWGTAATGATQLYAGMAQLNQGFTGAISGATTLFAGMKNLSGGLGAVAGAGATAIGVIAGVTAGIAAAVGVGALMAHNISALGEKMNEYSKRLGISVEQLSKWKFAADQSEISLEVLGVAFKILATKMADAQAGSKAAGDLFKYLGISVADTSGNLRSVDAVTLELIQRLQSLGSQTEKVALLTDLYGRSGNQLLPMFEEGSEGIQKMFTRMEKLGGVMSGDMAKASDAYRDSITELGVAWDGLAMVAGEKFLPTMAKIVTAFADLLAASDQLSDSFDPRKNYWTKSLMSGKRQWEIEALTMSNKMRGLEGVGQLPLLDTQESIAARSPLSMLPIKRPISITSDPEAAKAYDERQKAAEKLFREVMASRAASAAVRSGAQAARLSVPMSVAPGRIGMGGRAAGEGSGMMGLSLAEYQKQTEKAFRPAPVLFSDWDRFARYIKGLFQGTTGVWGSMKAGAEDFKRQLGSFRTILSTSFSAGMFNMLSSMQGGLQKGFSGLIFGTQKEDDAKKAITQLKNIKGQVQSLAMDVWGRGGQLSENQARSFEALFGVAESGNIPDKLKTRMGELKAQLYGITTPEQGAAFVTSMDELIGQLQDQTGLMGRIREFGSSLKDSMVDAFKFQLSDLLAKSVMAGLIGMAEKGGKAIWGPHAKTAGVAVSGELKEGVKPEQFKSVGTTIVTGIGQGLADKATGVASISSSLGQGLVAGGEKGAGSALSAGKEVAKDIIKGMDAQFIDPKMGIGKLATTIEGGFPLKDLDGIGKTIGKRIIKGADILIVDPVEGALKLAKTIDSVMSGQGTEGKGLYTSIGGAIINAIGRSWDEGVQGVAWLIGKLGTGLGGGDWKATGKSILSGIGSAFDAAKDVTGAVAGASKLADSVGNAIKGLFGKDGSTGSVSLDFKTGLEGAITGAFMGAGIAHVFAPGSEQYAAIGGALGGLVGAAFGSAQIGGAIGSLVGMVADKILFGGEREKAGTAYKELLTDVQAFGGVKGYIQRIGGREGFGAANRELFVQNAEMRKGFTDLIRLQLGTTKEQATGLVQFLMGNQAKSAISGIAPSELINTATQAGITGFDWTKYMGAYGTGAKLSGEQFVANLSSSAVPPPPAGKPVVSPPPVVPPPVVPPPTVDPDVLLAQQAMDIYPHLQAAKALKALSTSWLRSAAGGWPAINRAIDIYGEPFTDGKTGLRAIFQDADPTGWGAYTFSLATGISMVARQGLGRVPGSDDSAYPAILHGGERVLSAPQVRQMDGGGGNSATFVINIYANSDQGLIDVIQKKALPMIRADIKSTLTRESRFGTWFIDDRAVRSVLTS